MHSSEADRLEANFVYNSVLELIPELREQLEYYVEEGESNLIQKMAVFVSFLPLFFSSINW